MKERRGMPGVTARPAKRYSQSLWEAVIRIKLFELFATIGLKNDGFNEGIDSAMQKGTTLGEKIGATAAGIGKAVTTGLAAAGAAFAAFATQSGKTYADYEQLTGGVETLFKSSAKTVKQYSEDAYKTAGLSANRYMETITSFSASLLQGLGGDTEKAAQIGNMAVIDMADNANKMGTAIESIQNAYQGFAKQNYTMLDNLKLGYGGTKEEMSRLLADAEKISGIKYDLSSFSDLAEAIHVIQTEIGITGTTALEASETISGSWSSLKSAWTNVLTSLASGNKKFFNDSVDALTSSADDFFDNAMGAVTNVAEGFGQMLGRLVSKAPGMLQNLLPAILTGAKALVNGVIGALPAIIGTLIKALPDAGVEMLMSVVEGITNALPKLVPVAADTILKLVEALVDNIDLLVSAAIAINIALAEGLISALPRLLEKAPEIVNKLVDAVKENAPLLLEAASELMRMLAEGLGDAVPIIKPIINVLAILAENIDVVLAALVPLTAAFVAYRSAMSIGALIETVTAALKGFSIAQTLATVAQKALNLALSLNPIGVVIAAISALTAGIIYLWNTNEGFRDALIGAWEKIERAASKTWQAITKFFAEDMVNALKELPGKFLQIGSDIVLGVWDGISNKAAWLKEKVFGFFGGIVDGVKGVLGIHSPSKVFAYIAEMSGVGFVNKLESMAGKIKSAVDSVFGYEPDVDYQALIDEAVRAGDMAKAARLEVQRNLKIEKEGLGHTWAKTSNFVEFLPESLKSSILPAYDIPHIAAYESVAPIGQRTIEDVVTDGLQKGFAMVSDTILAAMPEVVQLFVDNRQFAEGGLFEALGDEATRRGRQFAPTHTQIAMIARSVLGEMGGIV